MFGEVHVESVAICSVQRDPIPKTVAKAIGVCTVSSHILLLKPDLSE